MADPRPDWNKGGVMFKELTDGGIPDPRPDWNKAVMSFLPDDPSLLLPYQDWLKGTVREAGSSVGECFYDVSSVLIHDIGEKTDDFNDEVVVDLTDEEAAWLGVLVLAALDKNASKTSFFLYLNGTIDGNRYLHGGYSYLVAKADTATHYIKEYTYGGQDAYASLIGYPNNLQLAANIYLEEEAISGGEHTFNLNVVDSATYPWGTLHFLKLYLLYGSDYYFSAARILEKGEGGITW